MVRVGGGRWLMLTEVWELSILPRYRLCYTGWKHKSTTTSGKEQLGQIAVG